jgi:hypothetical protein
VRTLIRFQTWLSLCFDRLLPRDLLTDGNREFLDTLVPANLLRGAVVYDVGGGKNPVITSGQKAALGPGGRCRYRSRRTDGGAPRSL